MNDAVPTAAGRASVQAESQRRARILGGTSLVLGIASFAAVPAPLPSAFPWLTLGLSLAGVVLAVAALRVRPRHRLAVGLAVAGLLASFTFPTLVVFVFVRYFNWNG